MSTLRLVPAIGNPIEVKHDTLVGRDPSAGVHLPDVSVSRKHARLVRRAEEWAVVDQGSANGTYVDGVQIDDAALRNGQEVRFGNITYRVELEEKEQPQVLDNDDDLGSPTVFQFKAPPPPAIAPMAARPAAPPPLPAPDVPPPPGSRTQTIPPGTVAAPDDDAGAPPLMPPPLPSPGPVAPQQSIPMVPGAAAPPSAPVSLPPGVPLPPGAPGWVEPSSRPAPVRRQPAPAAAAAPPPPPPAKRSRGALFWVLGGTFGCFALLALLVGVAIGIPFLVTKGAIDAVHGQVEAVKKRQYAQAYASFDAAFQRRISQQDFERFVASVPALVDNADALLRPPSGSVSIQNDRGTVTGILVGPGGQRQDATWQLVKVGDSWKVSDLSVGGQSPEAAPPPPAEEAGSDEPPAEEPGSNSALGSG